MALPSWTQQQILAQLDSGDHWSSSAVLYRFPTSPVGVYAPGGETGAFSPLNATQKAHARLAFATWNDVTAKQISEVSQWSQIEVANTTSDIDFAHAYFPTESSVWFNTNEAMLQNPVVGEYGFETFIHEFGHALGLSHMGDYNGSGDWAPSCFEDSTVYTVMSYFGPDHEAGEGQIAWGNWTANGTVYSPQTPMLNDVLSIQSIYGANTATRAGNSVYGFNTNITGSLSAIYDFTQNEQPIMCLYDAGGTDTLDLSGWSTASTINLTPGTLNSCNGMTNNLSIAYNCYIENLITGAGQDTLTGNTTANHLIAGIGQDLLQGGGGNDLLDGGIGTDTAVFLNSLQNYRISYNGQSFQVADTIQNRDGTDFLQNIEQIEFAGITESIHAINSTADRHTVIDGLYASYQIACDNFHAVLCDLSEGHSGITLYNNVERLQFSDLVAGLDVGAGQNTGEVYRLYLTVLGRNPETDPTGCGFWIDKLDRNILTTEQMVGSFLTSNEFVTRFGGTTNTNDAFVNLMYLNLLGRDGHPDSGFNFWLNVLNTKQASREQVVSGFMESPENVSNAAVLIGDHATFKAWVDAE